MKRNKLVKYIGLMLVIILLTSVALIVLVPKNSQNKNSETKITKLTFNPIRSTLTPPILIDYEIQGLWGTFYMEYQEFERNPCNIVNSYNNKVIAKCKLCNAEKGEEKENIMCVSGLSTLIKAEKTSKGQYFITFGGEGGSVWWIIYFIDFATNTLHLIEKNRLSLGPGDAEKYIEHLNKYKYQYYSILTVRMSSEKCEYSSIPECKIELTVNDFEECKLTEKIDTKFAEKCYKNWEKLNSNQKKEVITEINKL